MYGCMGADAPNASALQVNMYESRIDVCNADAYEAHIVDVRQVYMYKQCYMYKHCVSLIRVTDCSILSFHWNCCPPDIQQNTKVKRENINGFRGMSRYKFEWTIWSDLNLYRGIKVFYFGELGGIFSGNCHMMKCPWSYSEFGETFCWAGFICKCDSHIKWLSHMAIAYGYRTSAVLPMIAIWSGPSAVLPMSLW